MTLVLIFKSLILGSLVMLLSGPLSHAQQMNGDNLDKDIPKRVISRFEFLIGANLIYGSGSDFIKEARVGKFGFRSALGLVHTFSPRLDLELKLSYENKGYKFEVFSENSGPPPSDHLVDDETLNYATATLLPRYSIGANKKLEIGLGPYFGYLINVIQTQKLYYNDVLVSKYQHRPDPSLAYMEFDYGATLMIGSNVVLKERIGLAIQLLYSMGLNDINKPDVSRLRNNSFSLLVGISVNRKKLYETF